MRVVDEQAVKEIFASRNLSFYLQWAERSHLGLCLQ